MHVQLHPATQADLPIVKNLVPYYIYDMSEHMGWPCTPDGRFDGCDDLESYWSATPGKHPFILRAGDEPAGFVLILTDHPDPTVDASVTDFFVLRKFRRQGIGTQIARELFNRFPGRWRIDQLPGNAPAIAFWRKVVADYTANSFTQTTSDSPWGSLNVLLFETPTRTQS
jgi:predicted acetyltransferase